MKKNYTEEEEEEEEEEIPKLFDSVVPLPSFNLYSLFQEILLTSLKQLNLFQTQLENVDDHTKKKTLFTFFASLREKLIKILVLFRFSKNTKEFKYFQEMNKKINDILIYYNNTSANLYQTLMLNIGRMKEKPYDIESAINVLSTGTYDKLPKMIKQNIVEENEENEEEKKFFLEQLTSMINLKILKEKLPESLEIISSENGKITLSIVNEYEFTLTLTKENKWSIININILVNEKGKTESPINSNLNEKMKFLIQNKILMNENFEGNYIKEIHKFLNYICIKLVIDILTIQVKRMNTQQIVNREVPFKFEIPFHEESNNFTIKIYYWRIRNEKEKNFFVNLIQENHFLFPNSVNGYFGNMIIYISNSKENPTVQIDHFPTLNNKNIDHEGDEIMKDIDDNHNKEENKIYNLNYSQLNFKELFYHHLTTYVKKRLSFLISKIVQGKYYNNDIISNNFDDPFYVDYHVKFFCFENYEILFQVDWKSGIYIMKIVKDNQLTDENTTPKNIHIIEYQKYLNIDINNVSKVLNEIKKRLMLNSMMVASKKLNLECYDDKYYFHIGKIEEGNMVYSKLSKEGIKFLSKEKSVFIKFPGPQKNPSYLAIYFTNNIEDPRKIEKNVLLLLDKNDKISLVKVFPVKSISYDIDHEPNYLKRKYNDISKKEKEEEEEEEEEEKVEEKTVKKRRLNNYIESDEDGNISLSFLKYIIEKNKSLVLKNSLFQQLCEKLKIEKYVDGGIIFNYKINGKNIKSYLAITNDDKWYVEIQLDDICSIKGRIKLDDFPNITFQFDEKNNKTKITFNYDSSEFIEKFLEEISIINRMLQISVQIIKIQDMDTAINRQDIFLSLKYISIKYGNEQDNYSCAIFPTSLDDKKQKDYQVELTPSNELYPFLVNFLNKEKNMLKFLKVLRICSTNLIKLKEMIGEDNLLVWTIIPRNLASIFIWNIPDNREYILDFTATEIKVSFLETEPLNDSQLETAPLNDETKVISLLRKICHSGKGIININPDDLLNINPDDSLEL